MGEIWDPDIIIGNLEVLFSNSHPERHIIVFPILLKDTI